MIEKIPSDEKEFISDLQLNYDDAWYKAPEETLQWDITQKTLLKHISEPHKDWEFEVFSIFTTRSVDELKTALNQQYVKIY